MINNNNKEPHQTSKQRVREHGTREQTRTNTFSRFKLLCKIPSSCTNSCMSQIVIGLLK